MAQQEGSPSTEHEPQPSLERCPNCDRPLRFPADQPEAYCPSCGIFVEPLRPLGAATAEPKPMEDNAVRLQTAKLYLELDDVLTDELEDESAEPPPSAHAEAAAPEVGPEPVITDEEIDALVPTGEPAVPVESGVAAEAIAPEVAAQPAAAAAVETAAIAVPRPRRWHRILFYSGSVLVAFGGSGLALGSVFHDVFRVPFFGFAYDAFGQLNVSAVVFGFVFLFAGVAAMAIGARAGARPHRAVGG